MVNRLLLQGATLALNVYFLCSVNKSRAYWLQKQNVKMQDVTTTQQGVSRSIFILRALHPKANVQVLSFIKI